MSEIKQEVNLLDQFRQQHEDFIRQRDLAQMNFQQLLGAIYACEQMMIKFEKAEKDIPEKNANDPTKENDA